MSKLFRRIMRSLREHAREQAHRLKRWVLDRPGLREWLRRWIVTPWQLWHLRRVVAALSDAPRTAPHSEDQPVVVVLALRHWAISRAWETVFSQRLQARGCRVVWVVDDQVLLRCDSMLSERRDPVLCAHCVRFNRRIVGMVGVQSVALSELLDSEAVADVTPEHVWGDGFEERYQIVRASFLRLLSARPESLDELSAGERRMLEELLISAERVRLSTPGFFDTLQPDAVLALNGKFFAESILLDAAQDRGIPVWTYERGNRRDTVVLSPTPTAVPFETTHLLAGLEEPLREDERHTVDAYLKRRMELGNGQVRFLARDARAADLPIGRRSLALFTNLIWDSAVVGEDTLFEDMFDWVLAVVGAVAKRPEIQLAIRVHPAEVKVYWHPTRQRVADVVEAAFPEGLPPNVALIDAEEAVDSYELARQADLVLVYTSTIGQEAAALGKRVLVAARSAYSAAPFVVRPEDREDYLRQALDGPTEPPPRAGDLARRFLYRLYFEEMLEVPVVREDPTGFHASPNERTAPALERRLARLAADARSHADRRRTESAGTPERKATHV